MHVTRVTPSTGESRDLRTFSCGASAEFALPKPPASAERSIAQSLPNEFLHGRSNLFRGARIFEKLGASTFSDHALALR